ncbi:MAG TPA: AraC family transcriptional regulator [Kofleriaceae bacterium]|nr:AraC family transcriptional regulator [Kofleriaceae bacterium]
MAHAAWRGRLFLDAGAILYLGPGGAADEHAHNCVQVVWSLDGPFEVHVAGRRDERSAVVIPSAATHTFDASGRTIALLLVESHGARGAALDAAVRDASLRDPAQVLPGVRVDDPRAVGAVVERVLTALGVTSATAPITAITRRAIHYIEHHLDGVPRVRDVARELSVSTTRVTHLFTSEVGIPFRRFVLWTRIKHAVAAHRAGRDLTTAAIEAGFSDGAHFSRTFRAMFGLAPSFVLPLVEITGSMWSATHPARR